MSDVGGNGWWLLLGIVPWLFLAGAAFLSPGLRGQPRVVQAGTPDRFSAALVRAGGAAPFRRGLWLDACFVALFVLITTPLLAGTLGWWALLPVLAAGLDVAETFTVLPMLDASPTERRTRVLATLARCKLVAYLASVVALVVAGVVT